MDCGTAGYGSISGKGSGVEWNEGSEGGGGLGPSTRGVHLIENKAAQHLK